jgi:hypothetical protein
LGLGQHGEEVDLGLNLLAARIVGGELGELFDGLLGAAG